MKTLLQQHHRLIFYSIWLILSFIQAACSQIIDDEAYYWMFGQYPDWGYYDHPPMIGWLIRAGYAIFPNDVGLRLFPLLLNVASLAIIEKLLVKKDPFLFYVIAFSIAALQIGGFFAVPDSPLIFFTAVYFLVYKKFVSRPNVFNAFLMGLTIACLLYSKYHGILVVLFTIIANPRILLRYQYWLAGIFAILFFFPHLWWQYQHDWISLRKHLVDRHVGGFKLTHILDYVVGQILIAGPLIGLVLLPAAFLQKTSDPVERAMKFTLWGTYLFFFINSFRGKIEANWTASSIVPLIILAHQYLVGNQRWKKIVFVLFPVSFLLIIGARALLIVDILPLEFLRKKHFGWKEWPEKMKEVTRGLPVVFENSYRNPSQYRYRTGQLSFAENGNNNYTYWPVEDSMLGKPVYFISFEDTPALASIHTYLGWIHWRYDPYFISFDKVKFKPVKEKYSLRAGEPLTVRCRMTIPEHYKDFIRSTTELVDTLKLQLYKVENPLREIILNYRLKQIVDLREIEFTIDPRLEPGNYNFIITLNSGKNPPTYNSNRIKLKIN